MTKLTGEKLADFIQTAIEKNSPEDATIIILEELQWFADALEQHEKEREQPIKRYFVNVYKDGAGRFVSNEDHNNYEDAIESIDHVSTYIETVEIIRTKT